MTVLEIAENGKQLSVSRGHIVVSENKERLAQIPIDSILCLLLSAEGINLTKPFLVRMAEENIPVVFCGKNYMPVSILSPLHTHFKMLPVVESQIHASKVLKKQLWQKIVQNKIHNQYALLKHFKPKAKELEKILRLEQKVQSNDSDNKEAQAARLYFPALFGTAFIRDREQEGINSFLNYAYSVIRATFARAICSSGLLPLLGVKHHKVYNPFCLVDDMMEVCRPLADLYIYKIFEKNSEPTLSPQLKRELLKLLQAPLLINGQEMFLASASLKYVQSFVHSLQEKQNSLLDLSLILK